MDENVDFYIFLFSVFFLVKILEFQQKIPVFDANPSNYSFIRGLKRKKKLQFLDVFCSLCIITNLL